MLLTALAPFAGCTISPRHPSARAERQHGIALPTSALNIQCRGDAGPVFLDGGASTLFEMKPEELNSFLSQLTINSRNGPTIEGAGDPCINGWNVWPVSSPTFVPGNDRYGGFKRTWQGSTVPTEMLSCDSPVGDWLHIEIWNVSTNCLVIKMYTDWN